MILKVNESVILAMKTGYSYILQSVESDKEILDNEWNSINWNSIEYSIFKIQKWMRPYMTYVLPVIIGALFIIGMLQKFGLF